eukprot:GAHX01003507.1.p1 GENE.GAHX01003507.1~~GAHX01003507.1.p1  ORF type:complete len:402 (+),score=54.08 GAHX01003507.1:152-1357(+)
MSDFKQSLLERKIALSVQQKPKGKNKKNILAHLSIAVAFACVLFLIFHFSIDKNSQIADNSQQKEICNLTTGSLISQLPSGSIISEQMDINLTEYDDSSINDYIILFYDIFTSLISKLHKEDNLEFWESVEMYAEKKYPDAFDKYAEMKDYFVKIEYYYTRTKETTKPLLKIEDTNYNRILLEFACILYVARLEFNNKTKTSGNNIDRFKAMNTVNSRVIYQQLHLYVVLLSVTKTIDVYLSFISEALKLKLRMKSFIKLTKILYLQFQMIQKDFFKPYNFKTNIKYKGDFPRIENLMVDFEHYEKFLELNLFVIFMHIFEVDSELTAIKIHPYFGKLFVKHDKDDTKEIVEHREKLILNACKETYHLSVFTGDENGPISQKTKSFRDCFNCLFENTCEEI